MGTASGRILSGKRLSEERLSKKKHCAAACMRTASWRGHGWTWATASWLGAAVAVAARLLGLACSRPRSRRRALAPGRVLAGASAATRAADHFTQGSAQSGPPACYAPHTCAAMRAGTRMRRCAESVSRRLSVPTAACQDVRGAAPRPVALMRARARLERSAAQPQPHGRRP